MDAKDENHIGRQRQLLALLSAILISDQLCTADLATQLHKNTREHPAHICLPTLPSAAPSYTITLVQWVWLHWVIFILGHLAQSNCSKNAATLGVLMMAIFSLRLVCCDSQCAFLKKNQTSINISSTQLSAIASAHQHIITAQIKEYETGG